MRITNVRNTLLAAALCLAPSALMAAAGGVPGPTPQPGQQFPQEPADVKVEWAGNDTFVNQFDYVGKLVAVVTVSDAQTGQPIGNLSKGNFTATWSSVYPLCAQPEIKSVAASGTGIYRVSFGFSEGTLCMWRTGQYPVALKIFSNFNPGNPFSPGSYQGQVASLVQLH